MAMSPGGPVPVEYRARVRDASGTFSAWSPIVRSATTLVGVSAGREELPAGTILEQTYPNPFNSTAVIRYRLAFASHVDLRLFDLLGRETLLLDEGWKRAGEHTLRLSASRLASGSYVVRLRTKDGIMSHRLLLLR
jgi:hypothetical protein